jgi:hypothetical protein
MEKPKKSEKSALEKMPTRKLVASIKKDIRQIIKFREPAAKPKKG